MDLPSGFARGRRGALALLLIVLVADLWLWGQFCGWYTASGGIPKEFWTAPESVQLRLREKATAPTSHRISNHASGVSIRELQCRMHHLTAGRFGPSLMFT